MQRRRARDQDARSATRSSCASSAPTNAARTAAAGFGAPSGGIIPVRSLRTTFSQTLDVRRPTVRRIESRRAPGCRSCCASLWQPRQYCFRNAASGAATGRQPHAPAPPACPVHRRSASTPKPPARRRRRGAPSRRSSRASSVVFTRLLPSLDAAPLVSRSSSAIVEGFATGELVARNTPCAHTYGVRPSLSGLIERGAVSMPAAR